MKKLIIFCSLLLWIVGCSEEEVTPKLPEIPEPEIPTVQIDTFANVPLHYEVQKGWVKDGNYYINTHDDFDIIKYSPDLQRYYFEYNTPEKVDAYHFILLEKMANDFFGYNGVKGESNNKVQHRLWENSYLKWFEGEYIRLVIQIEKQ